MPPLPSSLRLPRPGVAALVALVGGVAIAVELLVPAPRPVASLRARACSPHVAGCHGTIVVMEIDRAHDPGFSRPPPTTTARGRTVAPRMPNPCDGTPSLPRTR